MNEAVDGNAILCGAIFGICAVVVGWVKNGGKLSGFQARGLALKLPVGIIIGAIAAAKGIPFDDAMTWACAIGLVSIVDQVAKAIVRRFIPGWLELEEPAKINPLTCKPPAPPTGTTILLLLTAIPLLGGCFFDSPPEVMRGHDSAALCVQRASANYGATIEGMSAALRAERKAHAEYALQKAEDNVRLLASKEGGKIDAEKALTYLREAYAGRDASISEMEAKIAKFKAAEAAGDREATLALSLMGELRKYDAAGIDPAKAISEASSIIVPNPTAKEFK